MERSEGVLKARMGGTPVNEMRRAQLLHACELLKLLCAADIHLGTVKKDRPCGRQREDLVPVCWGAVGTAWRKLKRLSLLTAIGQRLEEGSTKRSKEGAKTFPGPVAVTRRLAGSLATPPE